MAALALGCESWPLSGLLRNSLVMLTASDCSQ